MSSVKDAVSDAAKDSLPAAAAADTVCSNDPLPAISATSFADIMSTSGNCSEDASGKTDGWLDNAGASAGNGLNMDDIMEYLQCQDTSTLDSAVQNVTSLNTSSNFAGSSNNPALSASDSSTSQTLSLVALQNLASECSTIDLSSLCVDSSVSMVGSNGPSSGE